MIPFTPDLLDEFLKDYKAPEDMSGNDGLLQQLSKALVERAMQAEMTQYLGYPKRPRGEELRQLPRAALSLRPSRQARAAAGRSPD